MVSVEHSIKFVTEFDETHPISQRFLQLEDSAQVEMLEGMLKALIVPAIEPVIENINENGSYAILKVVK
jgi:hypothetical protein